MPLVSIAVLLIGLSGWMLGRTRPKVELTALIFTLFAVVTLHSGLQWAFIEGRLDAATGDPRDGAAALVVVIAAGEAVGLWLPWLLIPWAPFPGRVWAAVYCYATALLSAVMYYFPFDLVVVHSAALAEFGPPYLLMVIAGLPIAAIGYTFGWIKSHDTEPKVDDIERGF